MAGESFYDVVTEAIRDMTEHGFDSADRIAHWEERLRRAAAQSMKPPPVMEQMLRDAMIAVYRKMIERGRIVEFHPGVSRFTIDRVKPHLRAELDRRIMASANLIRLNRQAAINSTLRRFSGWSTSLPKGGSDVTDKRETRKDIRKALTQLPFEERRVIIDQSHKLVSALNSIIAVDGGAIAALWRSHWRQPGYNYREDHKERDDKIYAVRGNWALEKGLMKPGPIGYTDEITQPAEEPFCRCYYVYLYNLRSLPKDMLTKKGAGALEQARKEMAA